MTTAAPGPTRLSPTVDRFLDAIGVGAGVPGHLLAANIVLDAIVPEKGRIVCSRHSVSRAASQPTTDEAVPGDAG